LEASESAEVNATTVSRSGSHFVTTGGDTLLRLWDYEEGFCKFIGKGHSAPVNAAAISPDQRTIVSVGDEGAIFIWEIPSEVQDRCREQHK
jgi:WD40 repeat protein